MNDLQPTSEFRIKRGEKFRQYMSHFSATEKFIFGGLFICALTTMLILATQVNKHFLIGVPAEGGELREGVVGLPRTINPVIAITDVDRDIDSLIYAGLTRYDEEKLVPDIAKSWEISEDGLNYTFNLREDVFFQDGTPLTADDIAFTIQKIQDPDIKSPRRSDWANITAKVLTPQQIQFTLKQPYAPFLSNTTVGILPKHIWGSVSDEQFIFSQYNIEPIGAGPYKLSSVAHDNGGIPTEYHLTTWNKYYTKKPYLSAITFHFFADEENALAALDSGAIDSLAAISPTEAARLATNKAQSYTVTAAPLPRVFSVFFNQSQAPVLGDAIVREALNMSVDRTTIVEKVLSGYGSPIQGPLPYKQATSSKDLETAHIEKAQTLLEKNGWNKNADGIYEKKSQKLAFDIFTADSPDLKKASDDIKASWTALGASVGVKVFESGDLYQNVIRTRKYDALLFGEFIGKDRDLFAFWHSSQRNAPGLNVALYANSRADKLLEQIRTTHEENARNALFNNLYTIIEDDIPAVFLYVPDFIYVIPKKLNGVNLGTVTLPSDRFNSISTWYVNTDSVWSIFTKI